jgi:hypothetical protein
MTGLGDEVKGKTVILGKPAVPQLVRNIPHFMKPKCSLPYS